MCIVTVIIVLIFKKQDKKHKKLKFVVFYWSLEISFIIFP